MKTAYLQFNTCDSNEMTNENFQKIGNNSGNIVFDHALKTILKCTPLETSQIRNRAWEFDNLVVRDFIWIKENADMSYFNSILKIFQYKPIIPISVGLQSNDFKPDFNLHENTVRILAEIAEKAEIAVRGDYTAEILNKYGIQNTRVVGCPSMYFNLNYNRKVIKKNISNWETAQVLSNYKTLSAELNTNLDQKLLHYLENTSSFVEQTKCYFSPELRANEFQLFMKFYIQNRKIFFKFKDWYRFVSNQDFSIGARFHGNVVPVLAGVPSLFIIFDSRTQEMTDYFRFPSIHIQDFDTSKSIKHYYEMTDYSEFNKIYPKRLDNFIDFCFKNHLELTSGTEQFFYRKLETLRKL